MQCLLVFCVSHCDYDSFVDYLSYGKQDHIDTSQLSFIVKVDNFYDVEDYLSFVCEVDQAFLAVQQLV